MGLGWILSPNLIDQRHNGMSANAPHLWRWQHPLPLNLYLHLVIHEIAKEPRKGMKPEKLRLKKEKLIVTPPSALNYMQKLKKKKKNFVRRLWGKGYLWSQVAMRFQEHGTESESEKGWGLCDD